MTSQGSQHAKKKKKKKKERKKEKRNWLFLRTVSQFFSSSQNKKKRFKTSLTVQWLQTHLPMQGTWVPSLVQEDSTCLRAIKPMCHNYEAPMITCSTRREATVMISLFAATRESLHTAMKTQHSQNKVIKIFFKRKGLLLG